MKKLLFYSCFVISCLVVSWCHYHWQEKIPVDTNENIVVDTWIVHNTIDDTNATGSITENKSTKEACEQIIWDIIFTNSDFVELKKIYNDKLHSWDEEYPLLGYYFSLETQDTDTFSNISLIENYTDRIVTVARFQLDKRSLNICIYDTITDSCNEIIQQTSDQQNMLGIYCYNYIYHK